MDQKKGRSKLICMLLAIFMVLAGITIAGEQQEDWTVYAATTGNNAQYSLQGAVYWVYTNQSCTTRAVDENGNYAVLTTNANGETGTVSLDRGTYYVKEKTASTGYTLDTTVYTAIVTAGATTWVNPSGNNRVKEIPQSAPISIQKIDETTGKTAIAGAQFEVTYSDGRNISRTWVVKTGSDGIANLDDAHFVSGDARYKNSRNQYVVPLGTVTVKEKKAPHNYAKSSEIFTITIRGDGSSNETTTNVSGSGNKGGTISTNPIKVNFKDKLQSAPFAIRKTDAVTGRTTPSPGSTFKGAEFEVKCVSDQFTRTWRIKADANGLANLDDDHFISGDARFKNYAGQYALPVESTVTVKEVKAPKGYKISDEIWTFTIKGDDTGNDTTTNITGRGSQSGDKDINPLNMNVLEVPQAVVPDIQKLDTETGEPVPAGGASLAGAEYELTHDDGAGTVRTWIVRTDENGVANLDNDHFVSGDERYQNSEGEYALRLGTLTVKEIKAPEGYLKSNEVFTVEIEGDTTGNETTGNISGSGTSGSTVTADPFQIAPQEQVKRGDADLIKVDGSTDEFMAGIPFTIRSVTTGEVHVFVTNNNGYATTKASPTTDAPNKNKHSYKTNSNDYILDEDGNPILVDGVHVDTSNLDPEAGIWFSKDSEGHSAQDINDALGALPYGTYYVSELPVPGNDGKNLLKNIKFVVSHDGVVVDGGTRENLPYALQTEATDAYSNNKIGTITTNDKINDKVSYSGLTVNKNYILKAEAHWAKSAGHGKIDGGIVSDASGNEIKSQKNLRPTARDGYVNTTLGPFDSTLLTADGEELKGEDIVIFEYLYLVEDGEETLLVSHEDPEDNDQTISYPWVGTQLTDHDTGIRMGLAREDMELVDHVEYKNFIPNFTYTFRATLYDKETGQVLKDAQGNNVQIIDQRRILTENGAVDLRYNFNSTKLENKTVVSMVEIYGGGMATIAHEDMDDEEQTLHIPKIRTQAKDDSTTDEVGKVVGTMTDTVTYENLLPGYKYKMTASLTDKATGAAIGAEGETSFEVEASTEDPTRADGTVTVTIDLPDGFEKADIEGKTLVAFEKCYVKKNTQQGQPPTSDKVVALHADINDAAQTLHYPKVRTTGVDGKTDDHVGTVGATESVKDTVTYWNLVPGKSYTIKGKLVNAETGDTITTADDLTFTATEADAETGTKTITFSSINSAALVGKTVVCYEKLLHNDVEVTQHEVRTDEDQSVHYPWMKTTAVDELTGDHVSSIFGRFINAIRRTTGEGIPVDKVETIVDTVEYKNLIPGETYTIKGTLMNKETGETIKNPNGEDVTAEATLAANRHEADGSIELKFLVDSSAYTNTTFVCYEKLIHKNPVTEADIEVNRHENLSDEDQSVHAVSISTTAIDQHTGDHVGDTTGNTVIEDTVVMKNLVGGMEYTLKGKLYDKETGEPVLVDGQPYTAEKTFTAEGGTDTDKRVNQTETIEFNVDGRKLIDKTVVVYEDLYHNDVRITTHSDINDEAQTVHYNKVETRALDSKTKDHVGTVSASEKITDTVALETLHVGEKYTIVGKLMKYGTNQPLLDKNGNEITATKEFTAEAAEMSVTIEFTDVDTSLFRGQTAVVFEKVFHDNVETGEPVEVSHHEDPTDEFQSIYYPEITTHAIDKDTGGHIGTISKTAKVKDKVTVSNLITGMKYTIKGTLHYQADVKNASGTVIHHAGDAVLKDGEEVSAEKTFTAADASEEHILEFALDSSELEGVTVVAFEKLYHPEKNTGTHLEVVQHEDLTDEAQSVHYPKIGTVASDGLTADHVGATEQTSIIDTVSYENLIPGQLYKMKGVVMDKKTGKAIKINGETVEADSGWFTAESEAGTKNVVFNIDASELDGETIVCFEKIYTPKETDWTDTDIDPAEEVELTNHENIEDEKQAVHYPKVTTNARDKDTDDHVGTVKDGAQVKDKVTLENLIPGQTYTIRGTLMKHGTSQPVIDKNGNRVIAEKTVEAIAATMEVEVAFNEYDSDIVRGMTTVCFEYLSHENATSGDDVVVATHEEPEEAAQSVHYPRIRTLAVDSRTGDHVGSIIGRLINGMRRAIGQDIPESDFAGIIDTVSYENLIPEEEYVIKGTLMNKETGEAVKDADGKVVTATATLEAGKHDAAGEKNLYFSVDTSRLTNVTIVCYEKLMHKNPVTEELVEIDRHEDLADEEQSVHEVEIATTAVDTHVALENHEKKHHGDATGDTVIDDAVKMKNLVNGMDYTLKGTLHYQDTGEPVLDSKGKAYESVVNFTAEDEAGKARVDDTVHVFFGVDGKALEGRTVVVYEELFHNDVSITVHADKSDEAQSVYYPMIRTTLTDKTNGAKETQVSAETLLVDEVRYKNLLPGKYKLSGILMDKNTGEPLKDAEGNEVTQETTFTIETKADGASGNQNLLFTFDSSKLRSHVAVAYETLTFLDEEDEEYSVPVAEHKDLTDAEQSEWIVDIATRLTDTMTNSDEGEARESAEWRDHVSYWGLIPGKTYTMKGILMDKETGKAFKDASGKSVTATAEFKPTSRNGSVDLIFKADSAGLAGKSVVAFEELYPSDLPDTVVAEHKDIEDAAQTVNIIGIATTATDKTTSSHEASLTGKAVVVDRVKYTNLTEGREYILKAKLMDKEAGEALLVNGVEVTETLKFTPEKKDGYVDVELKLSTASLAGTTMVAYERLYNAEFEDTVIAHHEDINDKAQAVHVPKIGTTLTEKKTASHTAYAGEKQVLVDKVTYENLVPGEKHIVKGTLMVRETNDPLMNGSEPVTVEKTFTPESADGSVALEFTVDASKLSGKTLVAYENMYLIPAGEKTDEESEETVDEVLVAFHRDLTDEAQSAHIPKAGTKATYKITRKVSDDVVYTNLTEGRYIARGWLVDKSTGKKIDGTSGQTSFTVSQAVDGTVTVMLPVPASYSGEAVAFEEVYLVGDDNSEALVAEHKDVQDKAQTVTVPGTPSTGESKRVLLYAAAFACAVLLALVVTIRKRKAEAN